MFPTWTAPTPSPHAPPRGRRSGLADNASRYVADGRTHVESWFLRANHPRLRQAIWLKVTLLAPGGSARTVAEVWCAWFDGDAGVTRAFKHTVPVSEAVLAGDPMSMELAGCAFRLARADGHGRGEIVDGRGRCVWALTWDAPAGPLGAPLGLHRHAWMVDGPLPRNKTLTPSPLLRMNGTLEIDGRQIAVQDWVGMQGHNWGPEHSLAVRWGHCAFPGADGRPHALVEAVSARLKAGPWGTPWFSAMVIRRGAQQWRFDHLIDLWRQRSEVGDLSWTLRMRGLDGEAMLSMLARPHEVICLGYENPDGEMTYCLNSKLATVVLRVNPRNEDAFECRSEHGGALEFQQRHADPRFAIMA